MIVTGPPLRSLLASRIAGIDIPDLRLVVLKNNMKFERLTDSQLLKFDAI